MAFDPQLQTLLLHKALVEEREYWGGKLVLSCGRNSALSGVPAAASIAGAASLSIDSDETTIKTAMRRGEVDFVVNTLDEALRTLKNEIRQRRPLSVGLIADVDATLDEMVERGVQPETLLIPVSQSASEILNRASIQQLTSRGMTQTAQTGPVDGQPFAPTLILAGTRYFACFFVASDATGARALDAALLAAIPSSDLVRTNWIKRLPQYLRSARIGGRWVWLGDTELASLAEAGIHPTHKLA